MAAKKKRKRTSRKAVAVAWEDRSICPATGGEHMPAPGSMRPVPGEWIVDAECAECGASGAAPVSLEDIQW